MKIMLILLGVDDGSYDITEDQITAPDEDIAASDNEEVFIIDRSIDSYCETSI